MERVRIVTDSTANLDPDTVRSLDITVVPLRARFNGDEYLDNSIATQDRFFQRLKQQPDVFPVTMSPSVEDFERVYAALGQTSTAILSVHLSQHLSQTYANALRAKEGRLVRDRARVIVIDSGMASLGLGIPVLHAARLSQSGASLDEVARAVRGMLPQTHILFFVDSIEYLRRGGRITRLQAIINSLMNVRALLRLEDGEIVLMEKVRTRAKALERLHEFVSDFPHIEELGLVYGSTANEASNLSRRLSGIYPAERMIMARYGPVLAAHLGPSALGAVVYEGQER